MKRGVLSDDSLFPRICVKPIDSKRALIGFTSKWMKKPVAREGAKSKIRSNLQRTVLRLASIGIRFDC